MKQSSSSRLGLSRRAFLGALGVLGMAAAGVWSYLRGRVSSSSAPVSAPTPVAHPSAKFPERYALVLQHLTDRLFPEEPDGVGARSLNVWEYIQRELGRDEMQHTYRLAMRGAAQLDRLSRERLGAGFVEAAPEGRDQIIEAMVAGEGAAPRFDPPFFIKSMLALTLEGSFADPAHGGNRDERGWSWLGYAMHPPRPQCH